MPLSVLIGNAFVNNKKEVTEINDIKILISKLININWLLDIIFVG